MSDRARGSAEEGDAPGAPEAEARPQAEVRGKALRGTLRGGTAAPTRPHREREPTPHREREPTPHREREPTPKPRADSRVRPVPRSDPPEDGSRPTEPAMYYCSRCSQVASRVEDGKCADCGTLLVGVTGDAGGVVLRSPRVPSLDDDEVSELGTTAHAADEGRAPPGARSGTVRSQRPPPLAAQSLGFSSAYSIRSGELPERREEIAPLTRVDPLIGLVIAERYRILEPLGRGGMGIVYKVEHTRIGKLLAMKLLAGELSMNPEVVKRFKHEALTVSKLSSPNTVQVFDYGASDGLTYLVMELVNGEDLGRLLRAHDALHPAKLGQIVLQVCNSLAEAHQKGIVHRDIKPENIMITRGRDDTDFAKVLDFGLAKLREGSELNELTSQGAIVGTPYFMSPEQVKGDDVDPRSDVYSLGAVMYRALTGHYAFNGPTPMAVFAKHLTEDAMPPVERAPDLAIPQGMSDIVMRALAKDPAERFQRVEDMQSAILSELSQLGTSGIESLLDSQALQRIIEAPVAVAQGKDPVPLPVATRDEVEAYERRLSTRRWFVMAIAALIPLGMAAGGWHLYQKYKASQGRFSGYEVEPNDKASEANQVPFGSSVSAFLGKRLSDSQSDIDVFSVAVPDSSKLVSLKVTGLPNIPMCTQVFRKGEASPLAQFCPGKPNVALDIPRLRLPAGPYLFTVLEDMNPYGESVPRYVFENVSDEYTLEVDDAVPDPAHEVEPNDVQQAANPVEPGATIEGTLAWTGDVDVFCPDKAEPASKYRFRVTDEERDGVLAVSFLKGATGEGPIVRVHVQPSARLASGDVAATDRLSPFVGGTFEGASPWCAVVRATVNPLSKESSSAVPRGSSAKYHVTLEEADRP